MGIKKNVLPLLIATIAVLPQTSCIRDEEPNSECDIETATLHVNDAGNFFFSAADSFRTVSSTDSVIRFDVRESAALSALAPEFTITPGAVIVPESGSVQDFSHGGVTYLVRSADGCNMRRYTVEFRPVKVDTPEVDTEIAIDFEAPVIDNKYNVFYRWNELNGILDTLCWATGNSGYRICRSTAKPMDYPTAPLEEGVSGKGVKLETRSTLPFGNMVDMRLAAGNLYIGSFNVDYALPPNTMKATEFGLPFTLRPVRFTGYYQYTPGENYQNRAGAIQPDKEDCPDIYAVLYRNDSLGRPFVLHGDNVLSSPQIVAKAQIAYSGPTSGWTPFDLAFKYSAPIDPAILAQRGYSLTVVASSSRDGASFCGAVGSVLLIDQFRIYCKSSKQ